MSEHGGVGGEIGMGREDDARQIMFQYEEPLMEFAAGVNWLVLMKTAIMMLGFYPNNRCGAPATSAPSQEETDRIRRFYEEMFDLAAA